MKTNSRFIVKFYALLVVLFASCNGNAQTNQEDNIAIDIATIEDAVQIDNKKIPVNTIPVITNQQTKDLAIGHQEIRKILGNDIGQMQFDTQAANNFRAFMANTLLTTSSNTYNQGYNNSDYRSGSGSIQFCENGTFVEVLSGHLSIDVEGMSALSAGASYMPGYWEVAALPDGQFVILMYSTHERMLEDFPNGFLPWVVPKHGEDFVSMPGGELYKRTANSYCN